jgi:alpha-beta hydrolase superfamily lysophospholipase
LKKIDSVSRKPSGRTRSGGFTLLLTLTALGIGFGLLPAGGVLPSKPTPTTSAIARIKSNLPLLDLSAEQAFSPQLAAFFNYYGLDSGKVPHRFGTFESGPYRLAAHVYLPRAAVGSVFLLHGFFDHCGMLQHLIHRCIQEGFAVATFDLPGHGLSSGDPGDISDFAAYARVVADFSRICELHLPGPYHLVGHSTGAAIAIEVLISNPPQIPNFAHVVLAAPLVHHRFHRLARAQLFLIKPFADDLPRRHHRSSSDPEFVQWSQRDPLRGKRISLVWLEALYAWNDRLSGCPKLTKPVMIVQGTKDRVVDWRYNIAVLQKKFATVRVVWIEGGRHQLFNESPPLRAEVLEAICAYLKAPVASTKTSSVLRSLFFRPAGKTS